MDFSRKKLAATVESDLRVCPIHSVRPFALMISPVYVFMRLNEKFVSVKAPLDFFTPEDLARLASFESFYMPATVDAALPFRAAAQNVRALLTWVPGARDSARDPDDAPAEGLLPPTPYELSDAVLRLVGPLWRGTSAGEPAIEPFFVSIFVDELCSPLPGEQIGRARDMSVKDFERAILRSSWAVFLAIHLGYCDLAYLNRLRAQVFNEVAFAVPSDPSTVESKELIQAACATLEPGGTDPIKQLSAELFSGRMDRISQKISSRLDRVKSKLMNKEAPLPTIFGMGGFVDV